MALRKLYYIHMRNTILGILILISSCSKDISDYPDSISPFTRTHILAHKAGGGNDNPHEENTLEAAIYGFSILDGIETDIQMSRNGTLWLYHDEIIKDPDNKDKRIPGLTDTEINVLIKTHGLKLNTLNEILQWKQDNNNNDYISLDIKSWLPTKYSNT